MIRLRCSGLPLALACPGSVHGDGPRIDPHQNAADVGTAAHAALRPLVETGEVEWDRVADAARMHGADVEEVRILVAQGRKLWRQVAPLYAGALSEVAMRAGLAEGVELTGHVDILADVGGGLVRIADWKTGRLDHDHRHQMLGYAALALLSDPRAEEVEALVLWVRDGEVERHALTRANLPAWIDHVVETIARWNGTYRPGDHCHRCPVQASCDASRALIRRDVGVLLGSEGIDIAALASADAMRLYKIAGQAAKLAARVHDAVKTHVEIGGVIEGDGQRLEIEVQQPRKADVMAVVDVLNAEDWTRDEIASVLSCSVGAVEDAAKARAPKGKGAAAIRGIGEKLELAGAISRGERKVLKTRRI